MIRRQFAQAALTMIGSVCALATMDIATSVPGAEGLGLWAWLFAGWSLRTAITIPTK